MTPVGTEPATFRNVAQHLNHCATAVPTLMSSHLICWFRVVCMGGVHRHRLLQLMFLIKLITMNKT